MPKNQNKTDSLTNNDIDKIANLLDNRLAPLATKEHVKEVVNGSTDSLRSELKSYIDEGVETIMGGLEHISEQLAKKRKLIA